MEADFSSLYELIIYLFNWFVTSFDMRTIDTETIPQLLTTFYPIWNPIWELVNTFLAEWFNF